MGEKGIDPGAAQPNPGLGVAAMPHLDGPSMQAAPTQGAPQPQAPAGQPQGDPVGDAIVDVLDPLGIHKLF